MNSLNQKQFVAKSLDDFSRHVCFLFCFADMALPHFCEVEIGQSGLTFEIKRIATKKMQELIRRTFYKEKQQYINSTDRRREEMHK